METSGPSTVAFVVRGPLTRADLPGLSRRICALLVESGAALAVCHVERVEPDAVTVDALARLQLAAGRHGCRVRLRGASDELTALIEFMGLRDVVPEDGLGLEVEREAEERKQRLRVEEEGELDDRTC